MDQNLIISENYPELVNMFLGDEFYVIEELQWYNEMVSEGGNKYRFLNIVSHNGKEILNDADREFFFKMANAIKTDRIDMDADGFSIVNILDYKGLTWKNLVHLFSPKFCIFWGVDPGKLEIPCKLFSGVNTGECKLIYVPSISEISADTNMKRNLWHLVKKMFEMEKGKV